jgi:hypothetical protein
MGASMKTLSRRIRSGRSVIASVGTVIASVVFASSAASASSRQAIVTATTSTKSGVVLLILGGVLLFLGIIGFFVFTWSRRKRRPGECAAQREALELAERAVKYWEGARAHLEAVERERTLVDSPDEEPAHASLVAKAVEGLNSAMRQRDQCQMDLIRCMASGAPAVPGNTLTPLEPRPFLAPGSDGTPSSSP